MAIESPYTTAGQIESTQGNAAQGYSGGAVQYNGNPDIQNPLAGIDSTLARVQAEDARMREIRHGEKRQDMENTMKMLREKKGSLFNMKDPQSGRNLSFTPIPEDFEFYNKKALDYNRAAIQNASNYGNMPAVLEQERQLDNYSDIAQRRALYLAQETDAAAKETDPKQKQYILDNMNKNLYENPITNFRHLEPHQEAPTLTNDINPKDWAEESKRQQVGDGTGIPTTVIDNPLNNLSKESVKNAINWATAWHMTPESKSPAALQRINNDNDLYAAQRGVAPIHVAEIDPQTGEVSYNPNAREVYTALRRHSHGMVLPSEKALEKKDQHLTSELNREHTKQTMQLAWKKAKLDEREADRNDSKEAREAAKESSGNLVKSVVDGVQAHANYISSLKSEPAVDILSKYIQGKGGTGNTLQVLESNGIDPSKYKATEVPSDETVSYILGESPGKSEKGYKKATKSIFFTPNGGGVKDGFYLMSYDERVSHRNQKTGKPLDPVTETKWKMIPYTQWVGNTIHSLSNNEKLSDKLLNLVGEATIEANKGTATATRPAQPQATKIIGTETYSQY